MTSGKGVCLGVSLAGLLVASVNAQGFGRTPTPEEIKLWDIDVRPDGAGLLEGSGTVTRGREVYRQNCEACHGPGGHDGIKDRLVGGQGTLGSEKPVKTVGSFWPYATTLFDYIRRAMPYFAPGSLDINDTYAVAAYILNLNGLIADDATLDRQSLPGIRMPNRDGFVPDAVFRIDNERPSEINRMTSPRGGTCARVFPVIPSRTEKPRGNGRRCTHHPVSPRERTDR